MILSIIVPVYNVEVYLRKCVDSILAQTFTDFELILVDDGSPDGCTAICDEYAEKTKECGSSIRKMVGSRLREMQDWMLRRGIISDS